MGGAGGTVGEETVDDDECGEDVTVDAGKGGGGGEGDGASVVGWL